MNLIDALALTLLAMVAMAAVPALVALVVSLASSAPPPPGTQGPSTVDPLLLAVGTLLAIGAALIPGLYLYGSGATPGEAIGLRPVPLRTALLAMVAGLALQIPLTEVQNLAELFLPVNPEQKRLLHELMNPTGVRQTLSVLLAVVVVVPCCEEALFRGLILQGLRRRHGSGPALLSSALLFGLAHARLPAAVLPAAMAGLFLGLVWLRWRSLLPAILLHAAFNLAPLLLPESLLAIEGFNTLDEGVSHVPLPLLLMMTAVAAAALRGLLAGAPADGAEAD